MCSLEFPDLEHSFHQQYGPEGLLVLGLSARSSADAEDLAAFLDATGATFPVVVDDRDTYAQYAADDSVSPYPIDVVVDADGIIVYLSREYDPDAMADAVERVLR